MTLKPTPELILEVPIHTPYIVGFEDNLTSKFRYFAGKDCMEQFINHLLVYKYKSKVYLNSLMFQIRPL
jgi:hypothetical protein